MVTIWPILAYLISVSICLGFSTICHLMFVKSEKCCEVVRGLDYAGIAICFLGSAYPFISYKFACGTFFVAWRHAFLVLLSLTALACIAVVMLPSFQSLVSRLVVFASFFAAIMMPVVFLCFSYDNVYAMEPNLGLYALALLSYAIGNVFYISKFPEIAWPGKFDVLGASH